MREWISWPEACLHPLPPTVTDAEGALLEPLGVALHAVDLGQLRAGMTIGVFGCGPIGLLILQLARLSGASSIIATDVLQHRLDAAKSFGAHRIVLVSPGDDSAISSMSSGGSGMDVAFEVAGEQGAVDDAISLVSPGGKVILVGIPVDDRTSFTASAARRKGLTIKLVRRMKHTYARAIDLVAQGMVDVRSLVTHRFALDDVDKAFKAARQREGLKVIIEM
jgi:L-iditol 2-dehydrogenase